VFTCNPDRLERTGWLALLAMLSLVLLPTVSHALAAKRGSAAWAMACTSNGMRLVSSAALGDEGAPAVPGLQLEHCPCCAQPGAVPGMPPPEWALPLPAAGHEAPAPAVPAPRGVCAWVSAQARAPPRGF
jgi:hypothetical protein